MSEAPDTRSGQCMCGAVRFVAKEVPKTISACHCQMCRRWTGSALLEVSVPEDAVTWEGVEHIVTRQSTPWAERAWCRECGSGVYFRMTAENEFSGTLDIPLGIFDDPNGFEMTHEIFIDHKPDSFAYAGERRQLTRADCVAKFDRLDSV
ncbi:GFA family protein [uncultured Roseobacter sp.]|uniref:GFA family protein n=1 Tax=uncultured Roseobacter sp. TaxID=114847 RepID=UPI002639D50C|nr:GFA family protein [uncultured Roseobacter sp.]